MAPTPPSNLYIGLMSGTSMDAIDGVLVDLDGPQPQLLNQLSRPFPPALLNRLAQLVASGCAPLVELGRLDVALGRQFAEVVKRLVAAAGVPTANIRAIGSHGQTLFHHPGGDEPFSLQIGSAAVIAQHTGITTVADFRSRDIAAGGQGAPLVPAFHAAVFRGTETSRAVLNIGGMANITVLPTERATAVTGFDTGPGNVLLDGWAARHLGTPMDRDGTWAAGGVVDEALLGALLADDYFAAAPPKSTGREHFNLDWLERALRRHGMTPCDGRAAQHIQATLSTLSAHSIGDAIERFAPAAQELLICGGGYFNRDLIARLRRRLPGLRLRSTEEFGIPPQWVEATAFAWLAKQTLAGLPGNLPSVTGAREAVVLGAIHPGRAAP